MFSACHVRKLEEARSLLHEVRQFNGASAHKDLQLAIDHVLAGVRSIEATMLDLMANDAKRDAASKHQELANRREAAKATAAKLQEPATT